MNFSLDDMKGEKWKSIPGFDDYFMVSNYGRIWAVPRPIYAIDGKFYYTKERMRKQSLGMYYNSYTKDHTEQLGIHIRYEGKSYRFLVNRLVYSLFVKSINFEEDGLLVVHKDANNCNNRYDNLVLMNGTELYAHGLKINRRPRSARMTKKRNQLIWSENNSPRPIIQYALNGKKIKEFESVAQAAKSNNTDRGNIRNTAAKKSKQLNGFVYRYKGDRYKGEYANLSSNKIVTQYSVEGKKIAVYPSVKEASLKTGIDADTISRCALRKTRVSHGFVWRYEGDAYSGEYKGKIKNKAKPVIQFKLDGKKVATFSSVNQASIETGFSSATLLDCASKRTKVSHGFVWRFEGEPYKGEYRFYQRGKPVTQHTLEGKRIRTYHSIEIAAHATGLTPDNIQKNVKGENKTAGGFIWRNARSREIKELSAFQASTYKTNAMKMKAITRYSLEGQKIAAYSSISEAARHLKTSSSTICFALDKPNRTALGYVWRTKGNGYDGALAGKSSSKVVTQYNPEGEKINVFQSTKEAEKKTGIPSSTISAVANGKLKTTGGFIWQYGDGKKSININAYYASSRNILAKISKPVIKYSLEGKRIAAYPSIAAAARAEKISVSRISSAINGKTKSAIGHLWKLKKNSDVL